ncbi:MAG: PAS domain-containing protein [Deltaproteobacteria bacterium]|nr:PAS domain-containing protein [Deltaproteobacteria bacterium]
MELNQDVNLLISAFDTFKRASSTLESHYRGLEERIEELNLELEEKNNYLTSILEGLPLGVLVMDSGERIECANKAACAIVEEPSGELMGRGIYDILPRSETFHPATPAATREEKGDIEIEIKARANGKVKRKSVAVNSTVLTNLRGVRSGLLVVLRDISEMKRMREVMQRDKRLKAMGEMAASIAHQIRNPLASIELFASLLDDNGIEKGKREGFTKEIVTAVKTLNTTLSNMLLFANSSRPQKKLVTVDEFLSETIAICKYIMKDRGTRIRVRNGVPDLSISIDKELMKQALLNLIMNAIDALGEEDDDGVISLLTDLDEEGIHIRICDNGRGIPVECLDKIFDPFFTTRAKGTGLGLAVVNSIVKAHGGFLEVESTVGEGTVIDITLPEAASVEDNLGAELETAACRDFTIDTNMIRSQ